MAGTCSLWAGWTRNTTSLCLIAAPLGLMPSIAGKARRNDGLRKRRILVERLGRCNRPSHALGPSAAITGRFGIEKPSLRRPPISMPASSPHSARDLFSYRKYWAKRYGLAPFLPMSRAEKDTLGWDSCDIIIVPGDAYVDHPSFGMAVIGRMLEAQGFRVGILAQPDWTSAADFMRLGRPNLFFGITGGNMDSMVNRYTSDRKIRSNDAYTPHGTASKRPDRAETDNTQRARETNKDKPILIGGIEASLRRIAHYDYWSDTVRRSVLLDAKADLLVYGNAERQIVDIAHRLAAGEAIADITD